MKVEVLYFEGCPNYPPTMARLRELLRDEGLSVEIRCVAVRGPAEAKSLGFLGSPTIRINGLDIDVEARGSTAAGLACRRYAGGLPSEEMIRAALKEARAMKHE